MSAVLQMVLIILAVYPAVAAPMFLYDYIKHTLWKRRHARD